MSKLWIFGDSFSAPFTNDDISGFGVPYIKHKGYVPLIYSDVISRNLTMTHMNFARGGSDNYTILETICDKQNLINNEDLVIVGWSAHNRYRIINDQLKWFMVQLHSKINDYHTNKQSVLRDESIDTLKEIESWSNLLRRTFNNQIIFWTPFNLNIPGVINPRNLIDIIDIKVETNDAVIDTHYSETTYFELANLLINYMPNDVSKKQII
jgi:hypothetical protein